MFQECKKKKFQKVTYMCPPHKFLKYYVLPWLLLQASQVALVVKNLPVNAGHVRDLGSIPGLGRSPGEGHGNLL